MPMYNYYCLMCKNTFERNVMIVERDEQVECDCCNEGLLERKIVFKGSVWAPSAGGMK